MRLLLCLLLLVGLASCRNTRQDRYEPYEPYQTPYSGTDLEPGQVIAQGMLGASLLTDVSRTGGDYPPVTESGDLERLPMIAGSFQWPMWGKRIDAGLEAGGSLGFRTGAGYFRAGGSGLQVALEIDMYIFDLFGGPFVSTSLGDKVRIWGGAGPLMQFVNYSQDGTQGDEDISASSTGFGTGYYVRTGIDLMATKSMMVGIGARWVDSRTSLGSGLGNLDMQGTQLFVAFTSGF